MAEKLSGSGDQDRLKQEQEPIEPELLEWLQSKDDIQFIVVQHSHDDHTWYRNRQASEMRETEIYERALTVDSFSAEQMVVLKDFLDGGGKRAKDKLLSMIADGKMELIGQYSQPELFLSPEEELAWSSQLGRDKARELGGESPDILPIHDSFGFPETMPDIMHEFGQKTFQFKRGLEPIDTIGAVFWWEGPSGKKVLVMPHQGGYDNAQGLTMRDVRAEPGETSEQYYAKRVDAAALAIRGLINRYGKRFKQVDMPHMLFMDGSDFTRPDPDVPRVLAGVQEKMRRDYGIENITVKTGSLGEYSDIVRGSIDPESLQTFKGEMRAGKEHFVLRGIDSSRMYLKQAMHRAGARIYDAGVAASLALLARKYPNGNYLDRQLTENEHQTHQLVDSYWEAVRLLQPATQHDAVSGCGADDTYDTHSHALTTSYARADQTVRNAEAALAERNDPYGSYKHIESTRMAVNYLPFTRTSFVEVPLQDQLEHARALRGFVDVLGYEIEIPVQIIQKQDTRYAAYVVPVEGLHSTKVRFEMVEPSPETGEKPKLKSEYENDYYQLKISSRGVLSVTDKMRGTTVEGLIFGEQGDRGDEYNFCPVDDETERTTARRFAKISVVEDGPVFTELQIDTGLVVPVGLDGKEGAVREVERRSNQTVELPISTRVRLIKGVDRVEFQTTIDNAARDHRVRVHFAAPNAGNTVRAREPYTMTERDAVPIKGGDGWQEPYPIATSHHQGLLTAGDLAVYTRGLPEYEALTGTDGTIESVALTLFRGVGYLSRGNLSTRPGWAGPGLATPEAQMPGKHTFEYAISLRGYEDNGRAIRRADDYAHQLEDGFHDIKMDGVVDVKSDAAVVSAMYPSVDGEAVIVRLYNPTPEPTRVKLGGVFQHAVRCDGYGDIISNDDMHEFELPRGIATIRLS